MTIMSIELKNMFLSKQISKFVFITISIILNNGFSTIQPVYMVKQDFTSLSCFEQLEEGGFSKDHTEKDALRHAYFKLSLLIVQGKVHDKSDNQLKLNHLEMYFSDHLINNIDINYDIIITPLVWCEETYKEEKEMLEECKKIIQEGIFGNKTKEQIIMHAYIHLTETNINLLDEFSRKYYKKLGNLFIEASTNKGSLKTPTKMCSDEDKDIQI